GRDRDVSRTPTTFSERAERRTSIDGERAAGRYRDRPSVTDDRGGGREGIAGTGARSGEDVRAVMEREISAGAERARSPGAGPRGGRGCRRKNARGLVDGVAAVEQHRGRGDRDRASGAAPLGGAGQRAPIGDRELPGRCDRDRASGAAPL